jgi:hypothetical protein
MKTKMNKSVFWKIRDARGLNHKEKVFLFVVESRGAMTTTHEKAAADMGFSKDTYYRTLKTLTEKNLLISERRFNKTTEHIVNSVVLDSLAPQVENTVSQPANTVSQVENTVSLEPETKETIKENTKENIKYPISKPLSQGKEIPCATKEDDIEPDSQIENESVWTRDEMNEAAFRVYMRQQEKKKLYEEYAEDKE